MTKLHIRFQEPEPLLPQDEKPAADAPLKRRIIYALRNVFDPELPVNVYDLGLIYHIDIKESETPPAVHIDMTLTNPNCPVADKIPQDVKEAVEKVAGIGPVSVALVWYPPWDKERLTDDVKLTLNLL